MPKVSRAKQTLNYSSVVLSTIEPFSTRLHSAMKYFGATNDHTVNSKGFWCVHHKVKYNSTGIFKKCVVTCKHKLNSASLICMHCVVLQMWLLLSGPMYSCGKHTLFILLLKVTREKLLPEVITSLSLIIGGVQTSHCMCMNHSSYYYMVELLWTLKG